jgi:hypothetical protein
MGAMNMGQASPYVEAFSIARGSAAVIFGIIDRQSPIDSSSKEGIRPAHLRGKLQLRNSTRFPSPSLHFCLVLKRQYHEIFDHWFFS